MLKQKIYHFKRIFLNASVFLLATMLFLTGCSSPTVTTGATQNNTGNSLENASTTASTSAPTVPKPTKKVALTFDDGPHKTYTSAIVDELEKYGFKATFFVVGNRVDGTEYNGGSAASYVLKHGCEIGIHGYTHTVYYNKCTDYEYSAEMDKTLAAIKKISPEYDVKLMRPIGGSITKDRIDASPYSVILWSVDSEDWRYKYSTNDTNLDRAEKVETIVDNVMSTVRDGGIILMHDIYESTYDAVKILLPLLQAEGYEVVTVSELLGNPQPGTKYNKK